MLGQSGGGTFSALVSKPIEQNPDGESLRQNMPCPRTGSTRFRMTSKIAQLWGWEVQTLGLEVTDYRESSTYTGHDSSYFWKRPVHITNHSILPSSLIAAARGASFISKDFTAWLSTGK